MRSLSLDDWKPYFWDHENNRFSGIHFENLVAVLLTLEYPETSGEQSWHRTKESWDGKRDFYQYFESDGQNALRWVECKARQDAVSFNVLAPTLVMSTLRNTNEVIFFSYSRLDREAIQGLQDFANAHTKKVKIYDDNKLEDLIFRYKNDNRFDFESFFPAFKDENDLSSQDSNHFIEWSSFVYVYKRHIQYSMSQLKKVKLRVNELFEYRTCFVNQTLDRQVVTVEIDMLADNTYQLLDAQNRNLSLVNTFELQGGEIKVIPFIFKVTHFAKEIYLPRVQVQFDKNTYTFMPGSFKGNWLLETPYLGDMRHLDEYTQSLFSEHEIVYTVAGKSGVGKTRFLRELHDKRIFHGGKCVWSDAEHANGKSDIWLKQVLSQLYKLPLIKIDDFTKYTYPDVKERIVVDILYGENNKLTQIEIDEVASVLLAALQRQHVMLIIDNTQDFDETTIQIVNSLLNYIHATPGVHLLLSFNSDYIYQSETATALFHRLQKLKQNDPDHFQLHEITGLDVGYAELFIRCCLSEKNWASDLSKQEWRQTISQISKVAGDNPLYLEHLLLYLCGKDVLHVEDDHLIIFDNRNLASCLSQVPPDTEELLFHRWRDLKKTSTVSIKLLEQVLRFVCFFSELPQAIASGVELDLDAVETLSEAGFIRVESCIVFSHPLIGKFFQQKYACLSNQDIALCLSAVDTSYLNENHPAQFGICVLRQKQSCKAQVINAMDILLDGKVPFSLINTYETLLLTQIQRYNLFSPENLKRLLSFFIIYCDQQKGSQYLSEVLDKYELIYRKYLAVTSGFKAFGEEYFRFIKGYMNALLTEHHNSAVVIIGDALLLDMDNFQFDDATQKSKAKAMLYNRMHVALDRIDKPELAYPDSRRANQLLTEALGTSREIGDADGIIQNEIDFGYIYYLFGGSFIEINRHWEAAMATWIENREVVPLWEGGVLFHKALAATIGHDLTLAENLVGRVIEFHEKTLHNPYFYVKALVLHSIHLLMQRSTFREALEAINEAEDACTKSGYKGIFPICSHMRALIYEHLLKDYSLATIYYEKALNQYIGRSEDIREEERQRTTLLTIALALRTYQKKCHYAALSSLKSRTLSVELGQILYASDGEWAVIQKGAHTHGILYDDVTGIDYPCV